MSTTPLSSDKPVSGIPQNPLISNDKGEECKITALVRSTLELVGVPSSAESDLLAYIINRLGFNNTTTSRQAALDGLNNMLTECTAELGSIERQQERATRTALILLTGENTKQYELKNILNRMIRRINRNEKMDFNIHELKELGLPHHRKHRVEAVTDSVLQTVADKTQTIISLPPPPTDAELAQMSLPPPPEDTTLTLPPPPPDELILPPPPPDELILPPPPPDELTVAQNIMLAEFMEKIAFLNIPIPLFDDISVSAEDVLQCFKNNLADIQGALNIARALFHNSAAGSTDRSRIFKKIIYLGKVLKNTERFVKIIERSTEGNFTLSKLNALKRQSLPYRFRVMLRDTPPYFQYIIYEKLHMEGYDFYTNEPDGDIRISLYPPMDTSDDYILLPPLSMGAPADYIKRLVEGYVLEPNRTKENVLEYLGNNLAILEKDLGRALLLLKDSPISYRWVNILERRIAYMKLSIDNIKENWKEDLTPSDIQAFLSKNLSDLYLMDYFLALPLKPVPHDKSAEEILSIKSQDEKKFNFELELIKTKAEIQNCSLLSYSIDDPMSHIKKLTMEYLLEPIRTREDVLQDLNDDLRITRGLLSDPSINQSDSDLEMLSLRIKCTNLLIGQIKEDLTEEATPSEIQDLLLTNINDPMSHIKKLTTKYLSKPIIIKEDVLQDLNDDLRIALNSSYDQSGNSSYNYSHIMDERIICIRLSIDCIEENWKENYTPFDIKDLLLNNLRDMTLKKKLYHDRSNGFIEEIGDKMIQKFKARKAKRSK